MKYRSMKQIKNQKGLLQHIIFLFAIIISSGYTNLASAARFFEFNGLLYHVIDEELKTCGVFAGAWYENDDMPWNNIKGDITVPAIANDGNNDFKVTKVLDKCFEGNTQLASIQLPNTIEEIGDCAFNGCENLKTVKLPKNLKSIKDYSFQNCKNLESIDIPNSVESLGNEAFSLCSSLKHAMLPNGIQTLPSGLFHKCTSLVSITVPESVEKMYGYVWESPMSYDVYEPVYGVFQSCTSLKHVNLPENLKLVGGSTFAGCKSLETITLPKNLEKIGVYAFSGCPLREVIYPVTNPKRYEGEFGSGSFPIEDGNYGFFESQYESTTLKVATGGLKNAKSTAPWNYFKNIVESTF